MPILQNAKHEAFCQLRAQGKTLEQAYEAAGYKRNRSNAERLAITIDVRNRMAELQSMSAQKHEVTVDSLTAALDADRAFAIEKGSASAAVAATVAKAKLHGFMVDKSSVTVTNVYATMSESELREEIRLLHAEALAIKAGLQN